jgi:hypothetical protein
MRHVASLAYICPQETFHKPKVFSRGLSWFKKWLGKADDVRRLLHSLGRFLSHRNIKELVACAVSESSKTRDERVVYRNFTEKETATDWTGDRFGPQVVDQEQSYCSFRDLEIWDTRLRPGFDDLRRLWCGRWSRVSSLIIVVEIGKWKA